MDTKKSSLPRIAHWRALLRIQHRKRSKDAVNTKLRSTDVEHFTPKFLKKLGNPAFSKTCGHRFPLPLYQVAFD
jgi:hypothetical protein